jgi:hypothetical protein
MELVGKITNPNCIASVTRSLGQPLQAAGGVARYNLTTIVDCFCLVGAGKEKTSYYGVGW